MNNINRLLIVNIKLLNGICDAEVRLKSGKGMEQWETLENAYLLTEGSSISAFGNMESLDPSLYELEGLKVIDATGRMVFPSFCDSHTHLVYAGSREIEYVDKIRGLSYEEIAKRGGGILNSAKRLHDATEEELVEQALQRLNEIITFGTGAVEIKSGYGLNTEDELKMLRVIHRL
jgi:imidazolonepropionase